VWPVKLANPAEKRGPAFMPFWQKQIRVAQVVLDSG
jgi:hypothetical protein